MINWWHSLFCVDNMVTTGNDVDEMENLKHYLASKFDVKFFFFFEGVWIDALFRNWSCPLQVRYFSIIEKVYPKLKRNLHARVPTFKYDYWIKWWFKRNWRSNT